MPSLFSVSESDPSESAKTKLCDNNNEIIDLATDNDIEVTTVGESRTDKRDSRPSNSSLANKSDAAVLSSTDEPHVNAKDLEKTERSSKSGSKKRRVTPNSDSGSKKKQQKKVNQMTLSNFFFQRNNNAKTASTPPEIDKETTATADSEEVGASASPPRKVRSATNNPSPASTMEKETTEKNATENHEQINLDLDTDQLQASSSSTTSGGDPTERGSTEEINDSSKNEEGNVDKIKPSVETKLNLENLNSSKKTLAASLETKTTSESSSTNATIVLPESAVTKKTPSGPAHDASLTPISRKSDENEKGSSAHKAKESDSAKKTKSSELPYTFMAEEKLSEEDLSEERCSLLRKYRKMKVRYLERAYDVTHRHKDGLDEEDLGTTKLQPITDGTELKTNDANNCEDFPTQVVTNMAPLIEGSDLPLSRLVSKICSELKRVHKMVWSTESVSAKIKILSKRKAYFDPIKNCTDVVVDLFENNDQDRLWRWEVTTLDLLNSDVGSKARKARTARKKISSYQSALLKLVKSLEEIEKKILDPALPKLDKAKAKISLDEERVLKFERDAEKQRLGEESKARKLLEQAAKKKAREEALETKRMKKEEAAEKKKAEAQAREDEKLKREEEKLQKEEEKKRQERKKKEKQKGIFRSFFAVPKKEANSIKKTTSNTCRDTTTTESFNVELFRLKVNASTDVLSFSMKGQKRSASAMASRKRRTKMVSVSVYKTVTADDAAWGTSPEYLEQMTIKIPNKYRFLNFHEDCRPAYRGTWMKKSSIVTGKNPFRKDSSIFEYEYDSEAEWEEGDDEMGENVEDDTKNQDEEMDGEGNATKMYDFDDGFCVADDRLLDNEEDADDDTRALYKKKMLNREHEQHMHSNRVRIIAPGFGGVPLHFIESRKSRTDYAEGFDKDDVTDVLSSYKGIQLSNPKFCLDAFPQLHVNEENRSESNTNGNANKDDYSVEAMIVLARFSHHSTHTSKDKLIEELRTSHPTLFSIRAKATRKLDAISIKKKHPKFAGVYWEVKTETLTELGLTDLMEKKVEDIIYDSAVPEKSLPSNEEKSKNAPNGKGPATTDAPKKNKATNENAKAPGSASKKRKTPTKTKNSEQKHSAKKKKTSVGKSRASSSASIGNGKKESPIKKDACAGMKNLMAQFVVKKSPVKVKTTAGSPKDAKNTSSSSSQ